MIKVFMVLTFLSLPISGFTSDSHCEDQVVEYLTSREQNGINPVMDKLTEANKLAVKAFEEGKIQEGRKFKAKASKLADAMLNVAEVACAAE